jgi:hypothetical protein
VAATTCIGGVGLRPPCYGTPGPLEGCFVDSTSVPAANGGRDTGARWSVGSAAVAFALFALVLPSSLARFSGSWFPERWRIVGVHVQQDWSSADATAAKARTSNHRRPRLAFWHA